MNNEVEQVSLFDLDIWSGKMSPEPSVQTEEKTSQRSSKKQSGSQSRKLPMCLFLKKDGLQADASWEATGVLLGEYSMHSFGESPSAAVESHLSQILEVNPHQRYCLSAKACQGILNRASRRGKKLPEMLEKALVEQSLIGNGQANQSLTEEKVGALNCMHDQQAILHPVATYAAGGFGNYTEGVGTLRASGGDYGGGTETLIRCKHIVRRLTPLECERLQGFPDGWTDIGEWIDSNGKKHKEADSPRYKALGNSIAIPPWKWVLKRICACYERDATMASLFDGIGGFPYIWEQINGKGSCLWASEIEEFPMAVTKLRFGGSNNG